MFAGRSVNSSAIRTSLWMHNVSARRLKCCFRFLSYSSSVVSDAGGLHFSGLFTSPGSSVDVNDVRAHGQIWPLEMQHTSENIVKHPIAISMLIRYILCSPILKYCWSIKPIPCVFKGQERVFFNVKNLSNLLDTNEKFDSHNSGILNAMQELHWGDTQRFSFPDYSFFMQLILKGGV